MWTYQKPAKASSISAEHNWKLTCQQSAYNEAGVKLENGQKEGIFPCTCTNSREASWKMLDAVICTELSQKHHVRWVWRHKDLNIHSLICLLTQRVVIQQPPWMSPTTYINIESSSFICDFLYGSITRTGSRLSWFIYLSFLSKILQHSNSS